MVTWCCTTNQSCTALPLQFKQTQAQLLHWHLQDKGCPTSPRRGPRSPTHPLPKGLCPALTPAPPFPGLALTQLWDILIQAGWSSKSLPPWAELLPLLTGPSHESRLSPFGKCKVGWLTCQDQRDRLPGFTAAGLQEVAAAEWPAYPDSVPAVACSYAQSANLVASV